MYKIWFYIAYDEIQLQRKSRESWQNRSERNCSGSTHFIESRLLTEWWVNHRVLLITFSVNHHHKNQTIHVIKLFLNRRRWLKWHHEKWKQVALGTLETSMSPAIVLQLILAGYISLNHFAGQSSYFSILLLCLFLPLKYFLHHVFASRYMKSPKAKSLFIDDPINAYGVCQKHRLSLFHSR